MRCDDARVTLSAWLDGEAAPIEAAALPEHLDACPPCQSWLRSAERLNRLVRVPPPETPDLTARILTAVRRDGPPRPWRVGLRWVLGLLAVGQLLVGVPALILGGSHDPHAGRELAAFDIALAVGFLLAARYPARAGAFVPVAVVLAGCLVVGSGLDVAGGAVAAAHEAVHLLALVQAVILWILGRRPARRGRLPLAA
jgi:predicted anti-sigma-YlaC factor YlaD